MFIGVILVFITLTIILLPIPFKITLKYSNKILEVFMYNKKIKTKSLAKSDVKNFSDVNIFKSFEFNDIKPILNVVRDLKLKFVLSLNIKLEYGFEDAAFVAILFGLIHSSYSTLYSLLSNFIEIKDMNLKVTPHFKEKNFNMETLGIIYMNLVKIIYIAFVVLKCLIKIKRTKSNFNKFKGGNIHGESSN